MPIDRRQFIQGMGASLVTLGFGSRNLVAQSGSNPILVVVFQRGAVDGLNMVIPFGEREYYSLRPALAIREPADSDREGRALDLDGFFGFHPAMAPLEPLFQDGTLGVVHAAGSPDPTRSHFDAQDYMESATPGVKSTGDGWMNRYLQTLGEGASTPLQGVSIGATLPRTLSGRASTFSVQSLEAARLLGPMEFYRELLTDPTEDIVTEAATELFRTLDFLEAKRLGRLPATLEYPPGQFPTALGELAQAIHADVGVKTAFVEIGGWDHHVAEGTTQGQLANRLREFAGGLRALYDDLGDRAEDVIVVTMSEFGRTAAENGNGGTDHGHGNAMLVLGGRVKGGKVYGDWPGLDRDQLYEGRDLAVTTDFRSVLAEVLEKHLAARDISRVFPDFEPSPLDFIA